jgi:hypothetical protein
VRHKLEHQYHLCIDNLLPKLKLHKDKTWLQLRAADGLEIPYIGYVETDIFDYIHSNQTRYVVPLTTRNIFDYQYTSIFDCLVNGRYKYVSFYISNVRDLQTISEVQTLKKQQRKFTKVDKDFICYNCGKPGHIKRNCRSQSRDLNSHSCSIWNPCRLLWISAVVSSTPALLFWCFPILMSNLPTLLID